MKRIVTLSAIGLFALCPGGRAASGAGILSAAAPQTTFSTSVVPVPPRSPFTAEKRRGRSAALKHLRARDETSTVSVVPIYPTTSDSSTGSTIQTTNTSPFITNPSVTVTTPSAAVTSVSSPSSSPDFTSTSTSLVAATTSPSSAVSTLPSPSCPVENNTIIASGNGAQFMLNCGVEYQGPKLNTIDVPSTNFSGWQACRDACSTYAGCHAFNWAITDTAQNTTCEMLDEPTNATLQDGTVTGKMTVDPPSPVSSNAPQSSTGVACPASNTGLYTTPSGFNFTITSGWNYTGVNLEVSFQPSYELCSLYCTSFPSCAGFSYHNGTRPEDGVNCFLKSSVTDPPVLQGILLLVCSHATSLLVYSHASRLHVRPHVSDIHASASVSRNTDFLRRWTRRPQYGHYYSVTCGIDHDTSGNIGHSPQPSYEMCAVFCTSNPACKAFTFEPSLPVTDDNCYLKSTAGNATIYHKPNKHTNQFHNSDHTVDDSTIQCKFRTFSSCPRSNYDFRSAGPDIIDTHASQLIFEYVVRSFDQYLGTGTQCLFFVDVNSPQIAPEQARADQAKDATKEEKPKARTVLAPD
ncbi:hypothetical protein B0T19DRAFT_438607 [Cercophora scortea]|uniref:Apple domain-containing protein n=1 Tax=Cercophora scortea TaxID=314031 RepID=A0AAE0IV59_9PEZI|nr:hypothetical protein B0T19DRAFT_438607 [Cercophora scortea]